MAISDSDYDAWLRSAKKWQGQSIRRVILVEAKYFPLPTGPEATRYLSNYGYISHSSDSPANQYYDSVITAPPTWINRLSEIFTGRSEAAWGHILIANPDGSKDSWIDDSWEGRGLTILYGDASWPRADFRTVLSGVCAGLTGEDSNSLTLQIRDLAWDLNVRVPYGIAQISGVGNGPMPISLGKPFNISPLSLDDSTHKYSPGGQFGTIPGSFVYISEVRENGAALVTSGLTISTVNAGTDVITTSANHGLGPGAEVIFGATPPAPLIVGRTYYIDPTALAANEFKVYTDINLTSLVNITGATTGASVTGRNWRHEPDTFLFLCATPQGRITCDIIGEGLPIDESHVISSVNTATETITFTNNHNLPNPASFDVRVKFKNPLPAGLEQDVWYWVISAGFTSNSIRVSYTKGGSAVNLTSTTTGGAAHTIHCADDCESIIRFILTQANSPALSAIDETSFAAFKTLCPQKLGSFDTQDQTIAALLDKVTDSVGAFWAFDFAGALHLARFDSPAGSPVIDIAADEIVRNGLRPVRRIEPIRKYTLGFKRNYTIQPDVAGSVSEVNRSIFALEWRMAEFENTWASTPYIHPRDTGLISSLLVDQTNAEDEAERRATIYSQIRHIFELHCAISPFRLRLGQVIRVTHPRYGFSGGRLAVVTGIRWTPARLGGLILELFV